MAKLSEFGIPGCGQGILQPLLKYRFRVTFLSKNITQQEANGFSAQIVNVRSDFVKKTVSFDIQQPVLGPIGTSSFIVALTQLTDRPERIRIDLLDGSDNVEASFEYSGLKTIQHTFDLDYSKSGVATHEISMLYGSVHS
jgi:hypothetical protein